MVELIVLPVITSIRRPCVSGAEIKCRMEEKMIAMTGPTHAIVADARPIREATIQVPVTANDCCSKLQMAGCPSGLKHTSLADQNVAPSPSAPHPEDAALQERSTEEAHRPDGCDSEFFGALHTTAAARGASSPSEVPKQRLA